MRHFGITVIVAAFAGMALTSCDFGIKKITEHAKKEMRASHEYRDSEKWGKVTRKSVAVDEFEEIEVFGNVDIEYKQGDTTSVVAVGNEKAIEAYNISVRKGKLSVDLKQQKEGNVNKDTPAITLVIASKIVKEIECKGAGDIKLKGEVNLPEGLEVKMFGAGDFSSKELCASEVKIEVFGAGDISMNSVKCEGDVEIEINGAGDVEGKFECKDMELDINGAGNADIKVKCDELTAKCKGAGDIKLKGECNTLRKSDGPMGGVDSRELKVKKIALSSNSSPKEGE